MTNCTCHACITDKGPGGVLPLNLTVMIVCPICGNKRCPHAINHRFMCTGSNKPNQTGSVDYRVLCEKLIDNLREAEELVREWSNYADPYFQKKYNLQGDLDKIRSQIGEGEVSLEIGNSNPAQLTEEEIVKIAEDFSDDVGDGFTRMVSDEIAFANAIIARLAANKPFVV